MFAFHQSDGIAMDRSNAVYYLKLSADQIDSLDD
jgi:hypothetical protein